MAERSTDSFGVATLNTHFIMYARVGGGGGGGGGGGAGEGGGGGFVLRRR